ncbi:spatacsin isoform X2 [Melanotaenia boesemani]|uniref:spatacsin isoform X2 n=1 Tax=Melanotaenia boesemani TaxID=1250792 RepID=UPI001C05B780|nr:spatacsin isoform X2 [Melanotaenia boesemani]
MVGYGDGSNSVEVVVIPENQHCREVRDIQKAELCPGSSLLGCLAVQGLLVVWDPADREAPPAAVDGTFVDFSWEEMTAQSRCVSSFFLLAVGSLGNLKLLEVEAERSALISVLCVCECSADRLLQVVKEQNHGVCELRSVHVLSFVAGGCCVLLNREWLLQMQWQQDQEDLQILSCCSLQMTIGSTAVHHCVCTETLFILSSSGTISVHSIPDGFLLANIDLPAYLSLAEDDVIFSSSSSSSFTLLHVSADLSTAVALTLSHTAVAVDLNDYFRVYPDHLLCAAPQSRPPLWPKDPRDQDSLSSSSSSLAALGLSFRDDRSWEALLTSMYSRAQKTASFSSTQASRTFWSSLLPHIKSHPAPSSTDSSAPPGGIVVVFSVPESSSSSALSVSEFSALVTFVTPGNRQTTVALWDLESGRVSYHRTEGEAAPVHCCGGRQHRLLLKKTAVFQVLFSVSQQDLLSRLMLFGSAATVDAVCHLNNWGHCSIPIHTLQAGLKNRQLDTVDLYLKSKENVLNLSATFSAADLPADPSLSLIDSVQELCPALDLLCSAVRDSNSEAQSRQFSEQLLNITMSFVNTQIRSVLSSPHYESVDVQKCVSILDRYVTELRSYMKRFPWSTGVSITTDAASVQEKVQGDEWELLSTEEMISRSLLTNQIPRAQAMLQRQNRPEQNLSVLRMEGLRQVFSCLQCRDLQTANTLLNNMGLSVNKQLHSICLYTKDKDLRELMVKELVNRSSFSEEEMQNVVFIQEMEALGLLPPVRCATHNMSQRVHKLSRFVQIVQNELYGEEVLKELLGQRIEEAGRLWRNLQLDWVRNWDQSCQKFIVLSRIQHTELSCFDPSVLWRYLTALHDQHRVVDWIQSKKSTSSFCWPEITPELLNNTMCSSYMKENILDLLARRGLFIPDEMSDLQQLLCRLAQGGGLIVASPPVPQYLSTLGLDFHGAFITFCLNHDLQYLLYAYLDHHRLNPGNYDLLTNHKLSVGQPWLEMLVKVQEITRDLSDPGLIFQAGLTFAQVLLPGSQASVSSLLLEGHSLLALAAIMFASGGIDQVMAHGEWSGRSERTVDLQLLKMALGPHPKLRAALFPAGPCGNIQSSDISIYHLLQSLHPLDPSRLFSWQTANTLNSAETSEPPHFSSPHLVSRFALMENLDFLYYIRHGRPSFAYGNFLMQQLSACSDASLLLQQACQQIYKLALQCFNVPSVTSAAVCFCELLGVCSLKLRVDIRAMNTVLQYWNQHNSQVPTQNLRTLVSKGVKLVEGEPGVAEELIGYLEAAVTDSLEQRSISRSSYEAAQEWALPVQFCQLHSLKLSSVYPTHCSKDRQFIHFLLFVQLHNFPPAQVKPLVVQFEPILQAHLNLAFQDLQVHSYRMGQDHNDQSGALRTEGGSVKSEHPRELFLVLLQSQEEPASYRYLLQEALAQRCPVLAVLAACLQEAQLLPCLCVWLLVSVDHVTAGVAMSHLDDNPEHHEWTLHDLSIIWKTLLGRGHVRPLLRGFELFHRDCPLVLVLRMFELCCDYRKFTEAKSKLLDFQRTLITLRNGGPAPSGSLPLQWVESQASLLLLTMLQSCSSQYDLHRLLRLLADVNKLLKSNGPDFRKLSQLSQLLQGSGVNVAPKLLQCSAPSIQHDEFQLIVDALQTRGCYIQARKVAQLAGLPIHRLLLSQLLQEVTCQRTKRQWRRLETRISFWRKCHQQLKEDDTDPESASEFFLSLAETGLADPPTGDEAQIKLLDVQERCLLLHLTAHWLSVLSPLPVDQLERLEKKLWLQRIQKQVLAVAMEAESVFNLPLAVSSEISSYNAFMKDFSFSNITELNMDKYLSLQGLPGPLEDQEVQSDLGPEQRRVLYSLVGQLLDEDSIHEASRACRYFSLFHPDVWLVLRCHGLAGGCLIPETMEETSEGLETRTFPSSHSFSSLSAFVMLPLPEDTVTVQLQKLVDQCRHGNNYCKQVLSLYQLSKELQCSFSHICREDPCSILEKLLLLDQQERFRKAQAFIRVQGLSADTVAELVSSAVVQALLGSFQDLQSEKQVFKPSEGKDSLLQLIKLCDDPNLVGLKLLDKLNTVPLRDLNCIVELLIVAHSCFSLTCNMEGIMRVLQAARHLSHAYLAPGEHHGLLVRLLTGIGRYNEMTYIFDLLHQNHCFEMLLRKKVDTQNGQSSGLKTALLDYIKRCLPADSEKHNMVALCFSMRREIGENHEMAARTQLKMIESQAWVVTPDLKSLLVKVLGLLKDAAESFYKDSCVRQASRCVRTAKLVALQLHFLNQGSDLRIINLRPAELLQTVMALPRYYMVVVVSEAYGYSIDWAEILYQKVIMNGDFIYLEELKRHRPLTPTLFEDIFKKLDGVPISVTPNVKRLLTHCDDAYSRYRLAYQQNFYDVTKTLLQDTKTSNYLNDRLAS